MFRRRRNLKRRRRYGKSFKRRSFARRVRSTVYRMAEKKWIDVSQAEQVSDEGNLYFVTGTIGIGSGQNARIGNKINLRFIRFRIDLRSTSEDLLFFRVAIIRAKTKGLTIADCPTGVLGHTLLWDIDKWIVMYDRVISLGDSDTDGKNKQFLEIVKRCMYPVTYNDGSNVNADITNATYLYVWSNDLLTTSQNFFTSYRIYFTDI